MMRSVPLLVAMLLIARSASAQIVPCSAVSDQGPKILLDDIVVASGAQSFLQPLISRLDANLVQVRTELGVPLKVLPCANRRPSGTSDFTRSLVQELNVRDVLMEVWGTTTEVKDQQGRRFNEASVGYMLVPVRLDELQSQRAPGAFILPYRAQPTIPVDDMLRLVDQAGRLKAYAALSVGSKSLRSSRWGEARKQLCVADAEFRKLKTPPATGDTSLADYVRALAADVVVKARADPGYQGFLRDEGVTPACPLTP